MLQVTAAQQNDGRVELWVTDNEEQLWTMWQTSPGGNWTGWTLFGGVSGGVRAGGASMVSGQRPGLEPAGPDALSGGLGKGVEEQAEPA